ncbi:MAG: hypothetical protein ACE37J_13580 [Pikeienuella sp.]|uniref:hypothetical protein n=1 Tax=Pikeienuella sp. TaxID=2831957 RepID=UPI00391B5D30
MKRPLAALALLLLPAAEAAALTLDLGIRSVEATFVDRTGNLIAQNSDSETVRDDDPYTRTLSAFIGGGSGGFEASVGMASSGFFGIDAGLFTSGTLTTRVSQLETYVNNTALPIDLSASFIVVEGFLNLVAATGSTLRLDVATGEFPFGSFEASGVLTATDFVSAYEETGGPLNGAQAAPGGAVNFPFQQVTLDLGRLEPGDSFDYFYTLSIVANAPINEFARWVFVDPGAVAGLASPFQLTGTPAGVAPVPAPAPALLLVSALALLAARARRSAA